MARLALLIQLVALGTIAAGANAGTGIGWGVITVPVLTGVLGFAAREAVGLSVLGALGFLLSIGAYHYVEGHIDWPAGVALTCWSFLGGLIGTRLVSMVPDHIMRIVIGGFSVLVGALLMLSARKP